MKNASVLSEDAFERLLIWLHPDREPAALKYEAIRLRLTKIFSYRGAFHPEELADETLDRALKKLPEIVGTYQGDPALYFFGVANHVFQEYTKTPKFTGLPPDLPQKEKEDDGSEEGLDCLEKCLDKLPQQQRGFILAYYENDKQAKIDRRKELVGQEGLGAAGGRVRAYRIRMKLKECVEDCICGNK